MIILSKNKKKSSSSMVKDISLLITFLKKEPWNMNFTLLQFQHFEIPILGYLPLAWNFLFLFFNVYLKEEKHITSIFSLSWKEITSHSLQSCGNLGLYG